MSNETSILELSTVYFYKGNVPNVLSLRECGLKADYPISSSFSGLYGNHAKQIGFKELLAYAEKRHLQMDIIDFTVKIDQSVTKYLNKEEQLRSLDSLDLSRISAAMVTTLQKILGDADAPAKLQEKAGLVLTSPELSHIKALVHTMKMEVTNTPVRVCTIPDRYWGAISGAKARLNPKVKISLEPPALPRNTAQQHHSANKDVDNVKEAPKRSLLPQP